MCIQMYIHLLSTIGVLVIFVSRDVNQESFLDMWKIIMKSNTDACKIHIMYDGQLLVSLHNACDTDLFSSFCMHGIKL